MKPRLAPRAPITWLWVAFVVGWLPVIGATALLFVRDQRTHQRLAFALLLLGAITALYLWTALGDALDASDLTAGPSRETLQRRVVSLGAMALAVALLSLLVPHASAWWLMMHVVIAAGLVLPPRLAAGAAVVLIVATVLLALIVRGTVDPLLLILVAFGAGAIAIRQLTINVAQLRAAREELARAAVDQERLRFARDLHDLLGHGLSTIILKSELAGRLLRSAPDRAEGEVADVERAAREALREVRAAVAGYRQPVLRNELSGAQELLAAAGIAANVEQSAGALPPELDGLLAWAVREGVTNVIRHSRARCCDIRVARHHDSVRLTVTDDGRGVNGSGPDSGSGLAGLAERAGALGATLDTQSAPGGGFTLAVEASLAATGSSEDAP